MATTKVFRGDASQLVSEMDKTRQGAANIDKEYAKINAEARRIESVGRKAFRETRTAAEQYESKLSDLQRALEKGTIDQDTFARASAKAAAEFEKINLDPTVVAEVERLAAETRRLEQIGKKAFDNTRTDVEKYEATLRDLQAALKAGAIDQETFNRAAEQASESITVTAEAVQGVDGLTFANVGANLVSGLESAVQFAIQLLDQLEQVEDKAVQTQAGAARGFGQLGQLDNSEQLRELALQFRESGATESLDQAANLVFQLSSTGRLDEADLFNRLGQSQLFGDASDLTNVIGQVQQLQNAFGPEIGDSSAVLSKVLTAAGGSIGNAQELSRQIAQVGGTARQLDFESEETAAAVSTLFDVDRESAGSRARALFTALQRTGLGRGTLQESLEAVSTQIAEDGTNALEVLGGNAEAAAAFTNLINNQQTVRDRTAAIDAGNSGKLLEDLISGNQANAIIEGARATRAAEGRAEVAGLLQGANDRGTRRQLRELALEEVAAGGGVLGAAASVLPQAPGFRLTQRANDAINDAPGSTFIRNSLAGSPLGSALNATDTFSKLLDASIQTRDNTKRTIRAPVTTPESN